MWKIEATFKNTPWEGIDRNNDESLKGIYFNKIFKTGTITVLR